MKKQNQVQFTTLTKAEAERLFKENPARPGRTSGTIYQGVIDELVKGKPVLARIQTKQTNYIRTRIKKEHGLLLTIRTIDKDNVLLAKRAA